jgi:hypothetical protein
VLARSIGRHLAAWIIFCSWSASLASAVELKWLAENSNDIESHIDGQVVSIRTTGGDPYLTWHVPKSPLEQDVVLEFEYLCVNGIDSVTGYLGPPITEQSRFELPDLTIAQGWQSYRVDLAEATGGRLGASTRLIRLDLGQRAGAAIQIRNPQLRARTSEEQEFADRAMQIREQKKDASAAIERYIKASFPWELDTIEVGANIIEIRGHTAVGELADRSLQLVEHPPFCGVQDAGLELDLRIEGGARTFELRVPRFHESRDRLFSAWRLKVDAPRGQAGESIAYASSRRYPTSIQASSSDSPPSRLQPKSQKGLSGISRRGPLEELPELGIHAFTINLVLNTFVTETSGTGRERIPVDGSDIYFDPAPFSHYDDLIDFARQHDMVVTAIVLIPRSRAQASQSPLAHPESDGGIYAMPDLTSPRGTAIYSFVLDRIAQRYAHPARSPGGITNWIAHNEIDFHSVWTNMGSQPRNVLMETYYRSMRLIDAAARKHNPHARVFASLTHHWMVADDGNWRQLSPRETIDRLQQYSRIEGDFPWGVAYHPYPQSLFADNAWTDSEAMSDFDTPLITVQNLEVLGEYLEQPTMRDSHGERRPVLLSEQGYHTPTYDSDAQHRQAASLWYAMNKVRSLPWIESFHYHRWIDHPDEGGLLLGLRTLPTDAAPYGQPKHAWHVYRAFGTEEERSSVSSLPLPR